MKNSDNIDVDIKKVYTQEDKENITFQFLENINEIRKEHNKDLFEDTLNNVLEDPFSGKYYIEMFKKTKNDHIIISKYVSTKEEARREILIIKKLLNEGI